MKSSNEKENLDWVEKLPWDEINQHAGYFRIDPILVGAIIRQESNNNPYAIRFEPKYKWILTTEYFARKNGSSQDTEINGQKTSWGPMQIMGAVARELGFWAWFPQLCSNDVGVHFGCAKLSQLFARFKILDEVIASYNAGSPLRDKTGNFINQVYVDRVKMNMETIRKKTS